MSAKKEPLIQVNTNSMRDLFKRAKSSMRNLPLTVPQALGTATEAVGAIAAAVTNGVVKSGARVARGVSDGVTEGWRTPLSGLSITGVDHEGNTVQLFKADSPPKASPKRDKDTCNAIEDMLTVVNRTIRIAKGKGLLSVGITLTALQARVKKALHQAEEGKAVDVQKVAKDIQDTLRPLVSEEDAEAAANSEWQEEEFVEES